MTIMMIFTFYEVFNHNSHKFMDVHSKYFDKFVDLWYL